MLKVRMRKMDANEESDASDHKERNRQDRSKSVVWDHFRVNEDGKNICLNCERAVETSDGNTLNFFLHLRTRHLKKYEAAAKAKSSSKIERRNTAPVAQVQVPPWVLNNRSSNGEV